MSNSLFFSKKQQRKFMTSCPFVTAAMSNPNGFLGQKSCHYLNQGRTFADIL